MRLDKPRWRLDSDAVATRQPTALADAVRRGDTAAVRAPVAAKADVNAPQGDGTTALHWAAYNGDVEDGRVLLRPAPTSRHRPASAR